MPPLPEGHHGEKPGETMARFIVEQMLGVRVCCYDDRCHNARPDAIVHRHGGVPLELVSDPLKSGNQLATALDKIGNRKTFPGLKQGYIVSITDKAKVKELHKLEDVLLRLEDPALSDSVPRRTYEYEFILPLPGIPAGQVRFSIGSGGGYPIPGGAGVVAAASAILALPEYDDVPRKLDAYGGVERHAVLVVDCEKDSKFHWLREATPADVNGLPAPELDERITHFWVVSRYLPGLTMVWSEGTGWVGSEWLWQAPSEVLNSWDDPVCSLQHEQPNPQSQS